MIPTAKAYDVLLASTAPFAMQPVSPVRMGPTAPFPWGNFHACSAGRAHTVCGMRRPVLLALQGHIVLLLARVIFLIAWTARPVPGAIQIRPLARLVLLDYMRLPMGVHLVFPVQWAHTVLATQLYVPTVVRGLPTIAPIPHPPRFAPVVRLALTRTPQGKLIASCVQAAHTILPPAPILWQLASTAP
mmetsp:Transcript_13935/g.23015  ORF Transcript_13935/g.23015 Transcript_13935/m.23015 type:complete len:188 (+) Transcript_13935:1583-2146(+)